MEKVLNAIRPKPNPQQLLREWQRRLRRECRDIEREIRDIQREEKRVQGSVKEAARRNDMVSAKVLAKEIVRSKKAVNRLNENKAQLNSISMHLGEFIAIARTVGHLSKSAEVMKLVNHLMKSPEVAITMQQFTREMIKMGIMEEMVNDAVDDALDTEDIEAETEAVIDKMLIAIAGEAVAQIPDFIRREKQQQQRQKENRLEDDEDDEEGMEEIRGRLEQIRS
ncbi:hypothetical protein M569_07508 [Genlisea aurea]|uniref:Uncharacterized protein n=1 Tax=Genlisea aurea TaxID=192259 RepID=S8CJJ0_9LAMI|nr:hypothetical protein M569_07508 [Genlisea aurea]